MKKKIGILLGSLRKDSYSRKLANYMARIAPDHLEMHIVEIGQLPLYNQEYDEADEPLASYTAFRKEIASLDGILIITPEYNRSYPASIKNALDVGSRPGGQNVWSEKPGGMMSFSIGGVGGFGANNHLRQVTTFLNIFMMQQPEAYIGGLTNYMDAEGNVTNEITKQILQTYMDAYVAWLERFAK